MCCAQERNNDRKERSYEWLLKRRTGTGNRHQIMTDSVVWILVGGRDKKEAGERKRVMIDLPHERLGRVPSGQQQSEEWA